MKYFVTLRIFIKKARNNFLFYIIGLFLNFYVLVYTKKSYKLVNALDVRVLVYYNVTKNPKQYKSTFIQLLFT